jgi:hypothetical protein
VDLDEDTAKAVEQLRRDEGISVSKAVNALIRRALLPRPPVGVGMFGQQTHALGLKIDVSNVAEPLEVLEGPA